MKLVKCKALEHAPDKQLINVCCVDVKRQKGGLWEKFGFAVCLHYSLINRYCHWILVSMFSCKLAINKSRLCLCVRVNRCSGSGESTMITRRAPPMNSLV